MWITSKLNEWQPPPLNYACVFSAVRACQGAMFTRWWKWHFICESTIFLYANSIFFLICVQNSMLLIDVVHEIFALEDAVSFNFALGTPHVKRRVKSRRPASAAPTKWPYPESDQSTGNPLFTMTTSQRACKPVMTTRAFSRRNQQRAKALCWKSGVAKRSWWCLGIIPSNRCCRFSMISQILEEIHL